MPQLGFKARFAPAVMAGLAGERGGKLTSIRAKRRHPIKPGDTLYLYTGLRTKAARLLGVTVAVSVQDIVITDIGIVLTEPESSTLLHYGRDVEALNALARRDGFNPVLAGEVLSKELGYEVLAGNADLAWLAMKTFFRLEYGLPFHGDLITWKPKEEELRKPHGRQKRPRPQKARGAGDPK